MTTGTEVSFPGWARSAVVGLALVLVAAACGSESDDGVTPAAGRSATQSPAPQYSGFVGATEFIVGENRFPFAILSRDGGPLESAEVQVGFYTLHRQPPEFKFEAPAKFREVRGVNPHRHEGGAIHNHVDARGVYVIDEVNFDRSGNWGAEFTVRTAAGDQPQVQGLAFAVVADPSAPGLGELVPASHNLTLSDVGSIDEIETRNPPDNMHDLSVAQALEEQKPFVVVFATPLFCVTKMCGPVTDVAAQLHDRYKERVNFIHIEPWDLKVARNEGRLVQTDVMQEWNLPSEPWVFVISDDGRVAARFEGLVSAEELEDKILAQLNRAGSR